MIIPHQCTGILFVFVIIIITFPTPQFRIEGNSNDSLFFKIVRGLTPAIPPNEFLTPTNSKRLIKPRNLKDFKTTNIVTDHARNNPQSYRVDLTKTVFIDILFSPGLPSTGTT